MRLSPWTGATVRLDTAIKTKSTQRISLEHQDDSLALSTFPAELKPQAKALYQTSRAQRLMDFVAEHPGAWQAMPNLQLAFRNAPVAQRLFPHCHLDITEYVHRWSGNDFAQVGAHRHDEIRENLWPWLRGRKYAGPQDGQQLDEFLGRLGRRDAHLRPGITVRRIWPWAQAVDLDEHGALAGEVRAAVTELLTALDEPLPPAHT
jgi:O-acetyl-ADP-ribose deacetylase